MNLHYQLVSLTALTTLLTLPSQMVLGIQTHSRDSSNKAEQIVKPANADTTVYIESILRDWRLPGAAVAVVKNDTVLLNRGFGIRRVGSHAPVDEKTMFAIGSCTKAFTSTAIGMLSDEHKLCLDDRVIKYLPSFELQDPYTTRDMRIRDLLAMRSGLEYGDAMWILAGFNSDQIFSRLKFLKSVVGFRAGFTYVNAMYLVAGRVIDKAAQMPWSKYLESRIFGPLNMLHTNTSTRTLRLISNVASPHHEDFLSKIPYPVPYASLDTLQAAGGINSCAADMVQWLRFQLNDGEFEGKRLISHEALEETQTSQTLYPLTANELTKLPDADFKERSYCMGWERVTYRGYDLVEHDGSIDGMRATVTLVPEAHLGLVVLTNSDYGGGKPCKAIAMALLDRYLKLPFVDWSSKMRELQDEAELKRHALEQEQWSGRTAGAKFSHPLRDYAGTYVNELYGPLRVALNGKRLSLSTDKEIARGEQWQYDTIKLSFSNPEIEPMWGTFYQDDAGKITNLNIPSLGVFKRLKSDTTADK
jgi:CubicO group peptidase (beta-lactamase class C family)